jgi:pyridinium-3,5-bisthiocarboxylic acid mononucleotide nickel chelatase
VISRAQRCFRLLAEAEAAVHGVAPEAVEFHEVGALDAIADVVGCCLALEQLAVDRVVAGPIVPGHGTVRCAHGRMPVPVPAVAEMLQRQRVPTRMLSLDTGELTTPTGCALICGLADAFIGSGETIDGTVVAVGTGAGHKEIPGLVNAVRCMLLDGQQAAEQDVVLLEANLDDMTGEDLAIAADRLLQLGALDVWTTPVQMKKGRPGQVLAVLCPATQRRRLGEAMLTCTTTIGLRWHPVQRMTLPRTVSEISLRGQRIRLKTVTLPDGSTRSKPESDDLVAASVVLGLPLSELRCMLADGATHRAC